MHAIAQSEPARGGSRIHSAAGNVTPSRMSSAKMCAQDAGRRAGGAEPMAQSTLSNWCSEFWQAEHTFQICQDDWNRGHNEGDARVHSSLGMHAAIGEEQQEEGHDGKHRGDEQDAMHAYGAPQAAGFWQDIRRRLG